eukprot:TRINITY_DN5062_c0_g1_i2.p1 TRINITY_DN5062_c0_g1~~TRINITY_DN5062_c0_g1_i2.p1  ORF type:complete len:136 (+),score=1.13 TRINITY_DN5062_c0_g1_i2:107-514(+)
MLRAHVVACVLYRTSPMLAYFPSFDKMTVAISNGVCCLLMACCPCPVLLSVQKERRIASAVEWDIEGLDALFENPVEKTGSPSPFRGVVFLPRPFAAECAPTVVRPASSPYIPPRARSGGLWPGRTVRLRRLYDA